MTKISYRVLLLGLMTVSLNIGNIGLTCNKSYSGDSFKLVATAQETTICPEQNVGETEKDCPWAGLARKMINDNKDVLPTLRSSLPNLTKPQWIDLWGNSINFDEGAKAIIVDPKILDGMEELFGVKGTSLGSQTINDRQIVHAGMEHTYGYLFSIIKTPFGFKRARWTDGEIEKGFKIPEGTFGPNPAEGTLFNNITYFAGNIVFRDEPAILDRLQKEKSLASTIVANYDYSKLQSTVLEEIIKAPINNGIIREVILHTYFVKFLEEQKNTYLLIYTVTDPINNGTKIITAFPVNTSFTENALKPSNMGNDIKLITRYNGYVEGITFVQGGVTGIKRIKN